MLCLLRGCPVAAGAFAAAGRGCRRSAPGAGCTPAPGRAGPGRKESGTGQKSTVQRCSLGGVAGRMGNAGRESSRGCADRRVTTWGQLPPAVQSSEAQPGFTAVENQTVRRNWSSKEKTNSHRKNFQAELRSAGQPVAAVPTWL